jgi:hypothetical protein
MNDLLAHFRSVCAEAFAFLVSDYGFHEVTPTLGSTNQFVVEFTNNEISLRIVGEGYGTVARAEYVDQQGKAVPCAILDPSWQPGGWWRKTKRFRGAGQSQDEQVLAAASQVHQRDDDLPRGNYARLRLASARWQQVMSAHKNDA